MSISGLSGLDLCTLFLYTCLTERTLKSLEFCFVKPFNDFYLILILTHYFDYVARFEKKLLLAPSHTEKNVDKRQNKLHA